MAELNIDRLTLKLSGISELEGQRLARLITQELAKSEISNFSNRASLPRARFPISQTVLALTWGVDFVGKSRK